MENRFLKRLTPQEVNLLRLGEDRQVQESVRRREKCLPVTARKIVQKARYELESFQQAFPAFHVGVEHTEDGEGMQIHRVRCSGPECPHCREANKKQDQKTVLEESLVKRKREGFWS